MRPISAPRSSRCCRVRASTYIGEIDDRHKSRFLGDARALLFPIAWPEPFGLAMIEAMACGTPVLAFRNGAVNEVIDEGVTGHVVDGMDEAVSVLERVLALDRGRVRQRFDERFCVSRMARDYVSIYERLIGEPAGPSARARRVRRGGQGQRRRNRALTRGPPRARGRRRHSDSESGLATASSGLRSAATPHRPATRAAPIIRAEPSR